MMMKIVETTFYTALAGTMATQAFLTLPPCAVLSMAGLTLALGICNALKG